MLLLAITVADYFGNYYKFLTVTEPDMTPLAIERRYMRNLNFPTTVSV